MHPEIFEGCLHGLAQRSDNSTAAAEPEIRKLTVGIAEVIEIDSAHELDCDVVKSGKTEVFVLAVIVVGLKICMRKMHVNVIGIGNNVIDTGKSCFDNSGYLMLVAFEKYASL